jgi:hypothetical protein
MFVGASGPSRRASRMNPSPGRNFEVMDPLDGWPAWPTTSPTPSVVIRFPLVISQRPAAAQGPPPQLKACRRM